MTCFFLQIPTYVKGIQIPDSFEARFLSKSRNKQAGDELSPENLEVIKNLEISAYLNTAASYLQLNQFDKVIKFCTNVIKLDKHNVKALFRRAKAYFSIGDLSNAESDASQAQKLSAIPDAGIDQLVAAIACKLKVQESAFAKKFAQAFESSNK
jgi:tetratricopeptide (TPR) repeat protein